MDKMEDIDMNYTVGDFIANGINLENISLF